MEQRDRQRHSRASCARCCRVTSVPTRLEQHETAPGFDYGEFFFMDAAAESDPWAAQEGDGVDAIDVAHERGERLAFIHEIGAILAPIQYDFAARVFVELWSDRPEEAIDDDADDVAELDIDLSGGL